MLQFYYLPTLFIRFIRCFATAVVDAGDGAGADVLICQRKRPVKNFLTTAVPYCYTFGTESNIKLFQS